ncbi:polysaccharide deacetylase family protein [Bacteroidota bacterium]
MKFKSIIDILPLVLLLFGLASCTDFDNSNAGYTEILKWPEGKRGAVSLTYDGGTINQFRVAMPIMDRLDFPGSFFIVTGEIPGSEHKARFIGRNIDEITREVLEIPTDTTNIFERASAMRFLFLEGIIEYHTRAGDLYEVGKFSEAYSQIDKAFALANVGGDAFQPSPVDELSSVQLTSWVEMKEYSKNGHEFASHSISHPQFAILDDANLQYELEKSREEILKHLGQEHTFSMECPYGTENERVMKETFKVYPGARNRMPDPYVEELNRWNKMNPGKSIKEYVQWQRGPKSETSLEIMNSWIDTVSAHDNVWLVLVFHGVEGVGWESIPGEVLENYFNYIKTNEAKLWVATFRDVTKYIRERMNTEITSYMKGKEIHIELSHTLDPGLYDLALSMKTYIPETWKSTQVIQNDLTLAHEIGYDQSGRFIIYQGQPNSGEIIISEGS